jgi:hypothetical protein
MLNAIYNELNQNNPKTTLFGEYSTLLRHLKGIINHHQILPTKLLYDNEKIGRVRN